MKKASLFLCAALFILSAGCSDDSKDNDCTNGAKRCNGDALESCVNNIWTALPCTGKCVEDNGNFSCAAPPGTCTNGAKRCNGDALESCVNSIWTALPCTGKCVEDNGKFSCAAPPGTCTNGAKRCNGDALESCVSGVWTALPCTGKCVEDSGKFSCAAPPGTCTNGAKRCNGDALESCVNSIWTALPCTGKCVENNGNFSCVEAPGDTCEKGQTKCEDDGIKAVLWTCTESNTWTKTDCPDSGIEGARLTCRNASTCSTVLCPDGTLFNSETKVCQEHNHSNACTAGRTYCNGKTNYLYECLETGNEAPTSATDCTAEGKVCVKIDDDHSECLAEECTGNFCVGEVLHYCTNDHKIDNTVEPMDCTASNRICDINEYGAGECFDPECIHEEQTQCVDGDNTKIKTCINKRWVESKCPSGTCSNGKCQ